MTHHRSVPLRATQPFVLAHSLSFLRSFPPTAGEQTIGARALTQARSLDGRAVLTTVREEAGRVRLDVASERPIDDARLATLAARIRFQLSLDDDLAAFYVRAERDPAMAPLVRRLHGHHHVKFPSPFEIAVWAVLAQRSMRAGKLVKAALVRALGPRVVAGGVTYEAFPEAEAVARADLAGVVPDRAQADAIGVIARAFVEGLSGDLLALPYDDALARLMTLPRIGPWSSAFILFRGLGRMERLAAASGPILAAAARRYGTSDERELRAIGDAYGTWCGYWALYLRRS